LEAIDDRPFVEVRAELERRANAGDGAAARRLGVTFAECSEYQPTSIEQLKESVVRGVAAGLSVKGPEGGKLTPEAILRLSIANQAQLDRVCKNATNIHESPSEAAQLAFYWIDKAAALGDADAQAMYASQAFDLYDARAALANAEEIRERKQRAVDYLQQSLAKGDALALRELSNGYSGGVLYPSDPGTAYAYLYAYSLTPRASELAPEVLEYILTSSAASLDDTARTRARDEGRRLATCCGGKVQEMP
jgi:hypothetical protein